MIATRMQLVLTLKAATIVHAMKVLMTVVTHSNQEETAKVMKKVECPTFAPATIAGSSGKPQRWTETQP